MVLGAFILGDMHIFAALEPLLLPCNLLDNGSALQALKHTGSL